MKSVVLLIILCFSLGACGNKVEEKKVAPSGTPVTVVTVTNAAWDKTLSVIGTLYPNEETTVAAQVDGSVEETFVDFGDRIQRGDDLVSIDSEAYEAQLEQSMGNLAKAEASQTNARQSFDRSKKLQKSGAVSLSELDLAKAELDQAEAEIKAGKGMVAVARLNVQRSRIKAPIDGAVSQRFVERGDFVKVGSSLFKLVNDTTLKYIFQVPERYASFVKKDLVVNFTVDNYPKEIFQGQVYLVNPAIVTASRSFDVAATVPNAELRLKANTFARGTLILETGIKVPVLPLEAVVNFAGVAKVFVVEGDKAQSRTVSLGRARDGLQEIVEGVKENEQVVISGQNNLSDGALIKIKNPGAKVTSSQTETKD